MKSNIKILFELNPEAAFDQDPEWVFQHNIDWVVENEYNWILENKSPRTTDKVLVEYYYRHNIILGHKNGI